MANEADKIRIRGARVHNLQNVDLDLPRNRFIVITGPSGSGKSSLAFDTLYAEGQRRYLETLRVDTRALFEQLQRPDVDLIDGLPPTLCVSQHTGGARPRSTLATLTEIHDYLRLLYARLGTPFCYNCSRAITQHSVPAVVRHTLLSEPEGRRIYVLAPLVDGDKGDHKQVFRDMKRLGFLRARVDGVLMEIDDPPPLEARRKHHIEMVVDRLVVRDGVRERLEESIQTAVKHGQGSVIISQIDDGDWEDRRYNTRFVCPKCGISFAELQPRSFSFNSPYGACPTCTGLGYVCELDPERVLPDRSMTPAKALARLQEQLLEDWKLPKFDRRTCQSFATAFARNDAVHWTLRTALKDWPEQAIEAFLHGSDRVDPPFVGLMPALRQLSEAAEESEDADQRKALAGLAGYLVCPDCNGTRLQRQARAVRYADRTLPELTAKSGADTLELFQSLADKHPLPKDDGDWPLEAVGRRVGAVLIREIYQRLHFLSQVGLDYLTLDRAANTLSGGEFQRARLATYLGGGLLGVCYILDEPTMGLHPRDTDRLVAALRELQQRSNTVIVVEHDDAVMRQADYLVDFGPGAGVNGGRLLAAGTIDEVLSNPKSVTAPFLRLRTVAASKNGHKAEAELRIRGARHHNLKNIDVSIPLGRLVSVTGVSGSGKSSLARDILCNSARIHLGLMAPTPGAHDRIDGLQHIDKVIEVDQSPLGRSSRSSPATYTGAFDEIRKVFAKTKLAKVRGYKANRFSFNVRGGRCEECQGQGALRVPLQFLPDLTVPCPLCGGKRFNRATLEIAYRGLSIAEMLAMSVSEVRELLANIPPVAKPLQALEEVGLGYLKLGQPSNTLSGGEAQRVKLAAEFARSTTGRTLFLLDEPTTGMHFADVDNLLRILRGLVDLGNTVVVIEHHLDLIAQSDWVIDLGPEGGENGGHLVVSGSPREVAGCQRSVTGCYLAERIK